MSRMFPGNMRGISAPLGGEDMPRKSIDIKLTDLATHVMPRESNILQIYCAANMMSRSMLWGILLATVYRKAVGGSFLWLAGYVQSNAREKQVVELSKR